MSQIALKLLSNGGSLNCVSNVKKVSNWDQIETFCPRHVWDKIEIFLSNLRPRLDKFCPGGLQWLIMQIYANLFKINEQCYFSVISWPILIPFVLSDRAWCGLQNFYTEFRNLSIMQIYANLFKINEKCYFSIIFGRFWFCLFYLIGLGASFKTSTQNLEIH